MSGEQVIAVEHMTEPAEAAVGSLSAPTANREMVAPASAGRARRLTGNLWTCIVFFWKWWLGAICALNLFASVLVVGWTYRLMQRTVLRYWWKCSDRSLGGEPPEDDFANRTLGQEWAHWPNWVVQQNLGAVLRAGCGRVGVFGRVRWLIRAFGASAWKNLAIGVQGIFNTWVVTMPGCVLWLFAWYDGWNNSFNKGYEQAPVGPLTGLLGVGLFIAAMLYVPMAQARQAATGDWKAFYQFRLVRELLRRRWLASVGLAALYSLVSIPMVLVLRSAPAFFQQMMPDSLDWPTARAHEFLMGYYFWCSVGLIGAVVALRLAAARLYAGALLAAVQAGTAQRYLTGSEREALLQLGLLEKRAIRTRHVVVRAVGWSGSRLARSAAFVVVLILWFSFVAQIFVSEFLNYHPALGWLNQPLVQLPYCNYAPSSVEPVLD